MTMRNEKKVLLTPADIIRELHTAAKDFYRAGGIEATDEQLAALKESKEHIRRVLAELEDDGVCLRTNIKGRPLSELSPEELRRLPSGQTVMYFWLKPKNAKGHSVAEEWEKQQRMSKIVEVARNLPRDFPIRKILKLFDIGKFTKNQMADQQFQAIVSEAFQNARALFAQNLEAAIARLPNEVATPMPPEVATPGGALERIVERKENHHQEPTVAPENSLMMMTPESFHEQICAQFAAANKPEPGPKLTGPAYKALRTDESRQQFIAYLTWTKLAPIHSAGVLPDLLQNFRDAQKSAAKRANVEKQESTRQDAAEKRRHEAALQNARRVLESPEEYTAAELKFAQEMLKAPNVA